MKVRRGHERFIRRLEAEFSTEDRKYRGISSDLSVSGLFIRTNHALPPGTLVDVLIHLPDNIDVNLKCRVRRSMKTPVVSIKNGMGMEIIENDPLYVDFVRNYTVGPEEQEKESPPEPSQPHSTGVPKQSCAEGGEFSIITCPACSIKNRVRTEGLRFGPKCGKCGSHLTATA